VSLRLVLAELAVPPTLRRAALDELAAAAAAAFGCPPPRWPGVGYPDRLSSFARFTDAKATLALEEGREAVVMDELRRGGEQVGYRLRRRLGVRSQDEALRALTLLYAQLHIDLRTRDDGRLEVRDCLFSRFYHPGTCRIMGAMDEGVALGVTAGWGLRFDARLTEGAPRCIAWLRRPAPCA
jgi:hypothetical protein